MDASIDAGVPNAVRTETVAPRASDDKVVPYYGVITFSVVLATFLQALDNTIANVALPKMQGTLSATQDEMSWVLTSYIIGVAVTIPLSGWLANEFGRRRVFLTSIVMFVCSSALCGIAQTLPQIVLFRFLQGVGGAALIPLSQAVLFDINAPKNFSRAMALWGAGANLGPILGPVLGGWLTDDYSWRAVFYINVPIGIMAFLGLFMTLPESRSKQSSRFDFFGFAMLSLSVASFQLLLDRGQLLDWFSSPEIVIEAVITGLGLYLFLIHVFSSPNPYLNLTLFKNQNFVASCVFISLLGVVMFATFALLPPMLQDQLQYPVDTTGLVMAPRGIGNGMALLAVAWLTARFGPRLVMAAGLLMTAYSLWEMTLFSLQMGYRPIAISGLVQGFGLGLIYVPLTTVAFSSLSEKLRNEGTAFFSLLRNVGSSVGISIVTVLLTRNTTRLHAALSADITPYNLVGNPAFGAAHLDPTSPTGLAGIDAVITNQATMIAYLDDYHMMMILTLISIPTLLLIKKAPTPVRSAAVVLD